ncbi:MAG TPA: tripartite tricarboxylate transporter substrate binding protein [Burkholderiaceae bacterium]|nr:tripartite tricarboxylate transporter substrate binding protein [Burkholderiaceae bacterium]
MKLVVPFAAGGASDQIIRLIATKAAPYLGGNIVIDNRTGAGGLVGSAYVASTAPDGYTLLANGTPLGMYHLMAGSRNFDQESIEPLSMLYLTPNVICVPADSGVDSLDTLIKEAKAPISKMNFGSPGIGTLGHLCGEIFNIRFGTALQHVPFRGTALLVTELLAGRIDVTLDNALPYLQHIEAGKLRPLAMISSKRLDLLPEVPTLAELGVEDFDIESWAALWAPKGIEPAIAARIGAAFTRALEDPETSAALAKLAARPYPADPGATGAYRTTMTRKYTEVIETAGIKLD